MNHLHKNLSLTESDILKVHLTNPAYVMLMDEENYALYQAEDEYDYYGDLAKNTPFTIRAPGSGSWHLVIEQADPTQDVAVNVQIISEI
ncbi:MAG: DUF1883 domain-containing protein [Spirochaetia bacterium]|jgi:hypothetical protein